MKTQNTGKFYIIIVAGGKGARFGGDIPKLLIPLAGKPVAVHSLINAANSNAAGIVLVAPQDFFYEFEKVARDSCDDKLLAVIPGGRERTDSVRNGLKALGKYCTNDDIVLIHDGARPLAKPELFDRCAKSVSGYGAAIVAVPAVDTIKLVENGYVISTLSRERLLAAQTPQGFRYGMLLQALSTDNKFTDDAAAVEYMGKKVAIVQGDRTNIKITTQDDLKIAEIFVNHE